MILNEQELNNIKNLYGLNKDYVFDFVLTENKKYLIVMDNVFVNGQNGNSIGTIWENTHIFNELIIESLEKTKQINESIKNDISLLLENIKWKKDEIKKWIKDSLLTEQEDTEQEDAEKQGFFSKIKNSAVAKTAETLFKSGLIPFLQWIRRSAYTNIGIIVDVVVAILAAKSNMVVWGIIVLLDIYEIATGQFDPKDPDRKQMPYLLLIGDVLAFVFMGGIGAIWKKLARNIATNGVKKSAPKMIPYLQKLADKIPTIKSSLQKVIDLLSNKFGKSGIISKMISSIDTVLGNFLNFLNKLLSREGLKAGAMGVATLGVVKGIEAGINSYSSDKNKTSVEDTFSNLDVSKLDINPEEF